MSVGSRLSKAEITTFADMHRLVLPGSLVTSLGERYARSFYRYVNDSPQEFCLLRRHHDEVVAGAVASFAPGTLSRRLLRMTPVARSVVGAARRLPWLKIAQGLLKPKARVPDYPEILLIFTMPAAQGQGHGTSLVREIESIVAASGYEGLRVKTLADPSNKAQSFYLRCGFDRWGEVFALGKHLAVFTKPVGNER